MQGSRFISSRECEFHQNYKEIVVKSDGLDTKMITGVFGPARVWKNQYAETHNLVENKSEKQLEETSISKINEDLKSLEKAFKGDTEGGSILMGQSAGLIEEIESVSDIINNIVSDAEVCIRNVYNTLKKPQILTKSH